MQYRTLLVVIAEHERQGQNHQPLRRGTCGQHFLAELADAEDQIHGCKYVFLLFQEIHQYTQRNKFKSVFIHRQIGNHTGERISAQAAEEGKETGQHII